MPGMAWQNVCTARSGLAAIVLVGASKAPEVPSDTNALRGLVARSRTPGGPACSRNAALGGRASVVTEDAGPQRRCARIEQRGGMHLAGQSNASDGRQRGGMRRLEGIERGEGRLDPLRGVL